MHFSQVLWRVEQDQPGFWFVLFLFVVTFVYIMWCLPKNIKYCELYHIILPNSMY